MLGQERVRGGLDEHERTVGRGAGVLVGVHEEAEPPVLLLDVVVGDAAAAAASGIWIQAQHGVPVGGAAPGRRRVDVVGRYDLRRAGEVRRQPDRGLHPLPGGDDVAGEEALLGERVSLARLLFLLFLHGVRRGFGRAGSVLRFANLRCAIRRVAGPKTLPFLYI